MYIHICIYMCIYICHPRRAPQTVGKQLEKTIPQTVSKKKCLKKIIANHGNITTARKDGSSGNRRKVNGLCVRERTTACTETSKRSLCMYVCACLSAILEFIHASTVFPSTFLCCFHFLHALCLGHCKRCQKEAGPYADIVHCVRQMSHLGVSAPTNLYN